MGGSYKSGDSSNGSRTWRECLTGRLSAGVLLAAFFNKVD